MIGKSLLKFAELIWPINRSITGKGLRDTLKEIKKILPTLKIYSVKSGTKVFDWTVPPEWEVKDAYIICPSGNKICDFKENNLHLVGYSIPINKKLTLDELNKHLFSLPKQPKAIPYITSYYKNFWGFCISNEERKKLIKGNYHVIIKSKLFKGQLNYGELLIKGKSKKEIMLSTYICHPSMGNNEISGPTVLTYLAKWILSNHERKYSYRIIFIPETIGSITYLSLNLNTLKKAVIAGYNITCVGDNRTYSYLPSRNGNTLSDKVAKHVLKNTYPKYKKYEWNDRGSDERQYCAPGIDLPIATIMRSKYGTYPEYHTSLDNLKNVVTEKGLEGGYKAIKLAIETIEKNRNYLVNMLGEPQLGKRNLYPHISTSKSKEQVQLMMDLITWCDGQHSLLDIAEKIEAPIWSLYEIVKKLEKEKIIKEVKVRYN